MAQIDETCGSHWVGWEWSSLRYTRPYILLKGGVGVVLLFVPLIKARDDRGAGAWGVDYTHWETQLRMRRCLSFTPNYNYKAGAIRLHTQPAGQRDTQLSLPVRGTL